MPQGRRILDSLYMGEEGRTRFPMTLRASGQLVSRQQLEQYQFRNGFNPLRHRPAIVDTLEAYAAWNGAPNPAQYAQHQINRAHGPSVVAMKAYIDTQPIKGNDLVYWRTCSVHGDECPDGIAGWFSERRAAIPIRIEQDE